MNRRLSQIGRAWLPRVLILVVTVLLLIFGPDVLNAPIPSGATKLDRAELHMTGHQPVTVSLPHRWPRGAPAGPVRARYVFDLPAASSQEPRVLLIPTARLEMRARVDGAVLQRNTPRPSGEGAGFAVLMNLPQGGEQLEIFLERDAGIMTGYLSPIYIATESQLGEGAWRWIMGDGVMRTVALAVHMLMVFAITLVWLSRRNDPIFGWLFFLGVGSLFNVLAASALAPEALAPLQPYVILLTSAMGFGMVGLALAIIDAPRPGWVRLGVVAAPVLLCLLAGLGGLPLAFWVAISVVTMAIGAMGAGLLLLGGGLRPTEWDRMVLSVPFLLTACFSIRDIGVVLGLVDAAFLVTSYARTLILVAVLVLLMGRLVRSLNGLDRANELQRLKLMEQGAELSRLHQREQARMIHQTREEERQRLMRDLHDGLSGHLVSIIALAEKDDADQQAIEGSAREALEDLRLVINSLDVEDGDLRLALAGFRERLEPRLRRLGVALDWSMEDLPEVSGVTPAGALTILRILQEAVTNGLKHGPARRIGIRGLADGEDHAVLVVVNDLHGDSGPGNGRGMENMRRRARALGGDVQFDRESRQAALSLHLPVTLAEH